MNHQFEGNQPSASGYLVFFYRVFTEFWRAAIGSIKATDVIRQFETLASQWDCGEKQKSKSGFRWRTKRGGGGGAIVNCFAAEKKGQLLLLEVVVVVGHLSKANSFGSFVWAP